MVILCINVPISLLFDIKVNIIMPASLLIGAIIFIPLCIIIVCLFASRMNALTITMKHSTINVFRLQTPQNNPQIVKTNSLEDMNELQLNLLKVTSKYTLLACISLVSSTISTLFIALVLAAFATPFSTQSVNIINFLAHRKSI